MDLETELFNKLVEEFDRATGRENATVEEIAKWYEDNGMPSSAWALRTYGERTGRLSPPDK